MQKKDITLWNVMSYSSLLDRGVVPFNRYCTNDILGLYDNVHNLSHIISTLPIRVVLYLKRIKRGWLV